MIGREREAARLDSLVRAAMDGRGGALLVTGEAGIGKTLLLAHARAAAADVAQVLEATGAESESRLAFVGLGDLLGPLVDRIGELPAAQAAALRGALALGPPSPGDRFAPQAAAFGLLTAAADRGPVVCIIDDAHWLDAESLEAVLFIARRLGSEGIALLIAAREGERPPLDASDLERMRLTGLGRRDAGRLVAGRVADVPDPAVAERLWESAAGNPLALLELADALAPAQLAGREPLPDPLPVGPDLGRALLRPLADLPDATRRALLVASAGEVDPDGLARALAALGLSAADLAPAARAGVISLGRRVAFSHPLVRAAVYRGASAPDRRAAHRAHAAAADGDERRAWHLALAATGLDETAAAALEASGRVAAARRGYLAAAEAFETAAALSPQPGDRARRLIDAGQAAVAAGALQRGAGLFDACRALAADDSSVTRATALRAIVETFAGSMSEALDMLVAAAERARDAPAVSAGLLVQGVLPCLNSAEIVRAEALVAAARERAGARPPAPLDTFIAAADATVTAYRGRPVRLPDGLVDALHALADQGDAAARAWWISCGWIHMTAERADEAMRLVSAAVDEARERAAISDLSWPMTARGDLLRRSGRLDEALADVSEALALADETGQAPMAAYALLVTAQVHAVAGRRADCLDAASRATAVIGARGLTGLVGLLDGALGLMELGDRDPLAALPHLTSAVARYGEGEFHPQLVGFEADLAEVLLRLGRIEEASQATARFEHRATLAGAPTPQAVAARLRGLLADDGDFEAAFADALALHDRGHAPLERARTLLCLGERRRRARRTRDARAALAEALEGFTAIGAGGWASWARDELSAAGVRVALPSAHAMDILTPRELQVAVAVASGATTREAAAGLFISPRTVEAHLGRVYGKLGVRSRAGLAARIGPGAPP